MSRSYWPEAKAVIPIGRLFLFVFVFVIAATAGPCFSQEAAPEAHAPSITVKSRLVVLDVVATGVDGKPVRGLGPADFHVLDGGQPQKIRFFEGPSAHDLPSASGVGVTFDPASPLAFGQSPVLVLVLDQLNTHFADSSFARTQLHDYLAQQPALLPQPTTLLTVYDNQYKELAPFSRDREMLLKALAATPTRYAWKLEQGGNSDVDSGPVDRLQQSLNALESLTQSYARIPGRKNLVWVGGGFPSLSPTTLDGDDAVEVKATLQHITDVLLDARVTLYAVDPTSIAAGLTEITSVDQADFATAAGGLAAGTQSFDSSADFDKLAVATGGRVVRGLSDVSQQIASAVLQGVVYYTLSYSPTNGDDRPGAYRKITVLCLRPGVKVTTRQGYFPSPIKSETRARTDLSYDLSAAAESSVPLHAARLTVVPAPEARTFVLAVPAPDLTWSANPDGTSTAHVAVLAVSLSAKGTTVNHKLQTMTATARAGTDLRNPKHLAEFRMVIPSSGKARTLRFVIRDATTGHMGSADIPESSR